MCGTGRGEIRGARRAAIECNATAVSRQRCSPGSNAADRPGSLALGEIQWSLNRAREESVRQKVCETGCGDNLDGKVRKRRSSWLQLAFATQAATLDPRCAFWQPAL